MKRLLIAAVLAVLGAGVGALWCARAASAHCDTLDGPVVSAARQALQTGNADYVLPWVAERDEPEIKAAFAHARQVRTLGARAQELADRFFFETLVRVHRAGEGAPYTGLKPAGADANPAVAAADQAFASGSEEAVTKLLTEAVREGVHTRFTAAKAAQSGNVEDIAARRRGVHGYVEFVHYVEGIHAAATGAASEGGAGHAAEVSHASGEGARRAGQ